MLTVGNYHYIRNDFTKPYSSIFGITPDNFRKQLEFLKGKGEFVSPKQLIEDYFRIVNSDTNYYLITFDDGLKEQFDLALPVLQKLDIHALFFINSINHIEKKVSLVHKIHIVRSDVAPEEIVNGFKSNGLNTDLNSVEINKAIAHYKYDKPETAKLKYLLNFKLDKMSVENNINVFFESNYKREMVVENLYMSKNQLQELGSLDMLGSHTHSHLPLGLLGEKHIFQEIYKTKCFLKKITSKNIDYISYPYGSAEACRSPVANIARKHGYKIGFTMNRGKNTGIEDKLLLNRYACNDLPGWVK
jgi:peptidoglycan/xylan/chitin deacetylase (PgdA/CDA1 family)